MNEKIKALPTHRDYNDAAEMCSEEFRSKGGPWAAMYSYEKFGQQHQSGFDNLIRAGRLARLIEPLDENLEPVDSLLRTTHAYKLGAIAGIKLTDAAHAVQTQPDRMFHLVAICLENAVGEPSESSDAIMTETLLEIGEEGIEHVGAETVEVVDSWGADVVSDARVRRMFRLGCGAMIYAAYTIHDAHNDMQIEKLVASPVWSDELDRLLVSDTGE